MATDPAESTAGEDWDGHGVTTWEPRTLVDRLLVRYTSTVLRGAVVAVGSLIFVAVLFVLLVQVVLNPGSALVVVLFPVSVAPALVLVYYVRRQDITTEPLFLLAATYLLGIVLASFPYLINTLTSAVLSPVRSVPVLGFAVQTAQFFLIVGPIEEVAKLSAVYLYVYRKPQFDTVVDGAVYGAVAGLGFATIENVSYIVQTLSTADSTVGLLVQGGVVTTTRSFAGPGHVLWTGLAGYFLGLAKFNDEYALPLVVKGLGVATLVHAVYNTTATGLSGALSFVGVPGVVGFAGTLVFITVYHGTVGGYLFGKLRRYNDVHTDASAETSATEAGNGSGNDPSEPSTGGMEDDPRYRDIVEWSSGFDEDDGDGRDDS